MRVAVGALLQETNTFSPQPTRREMFSLLYGDAVIEQHRTENSELGGFYETLDAAGVEVVPTLAGWAVSYGRILRADLDFLVEEVSRLIKAAGEIDGVLLALHGAWAGEGIDSCDGYLLQHLRRMLGNDFPLVVTLDMHANLAQSMWTSADMLFGYRTCPHVDLRDTGIRAAKAMLSLMRGEIAPRMHVEKIPMVVQAEKMISDRGEFREILEFAESLTHQPGVVDVSLFPCQPWLDVEELGWAVSVITNGDSELAQATAKQLVDFVWKRRRTFVVPLPTIEEALDAALKVDGGPVVIGEGADGTMGGSPGDSASILAAILDRGIDVPVAAFVVDPWVVEIACNAGVGSTITVEVGGRLNPQFARPVPITAKVRLISDGEFRYKGRGYHGRLVQMGRAAVLTIGEISLLVAARTAPTIDPELYRSHGIEPRDMKIVLTKSPLGMRAEYEPIAKAILIVDSPGCCCPNLLSLPFVRIPRPMFPFDEVELPAARPEEFGLISDPTVKVQL